MHAFLRLLPKSSNFNHLTISYYFTHNLALNPVLFDARFQTSSPLSQQPTQDPTKAIEIATQLSNCASLQHLNQIYAHIIRTHLLHFNPAPFHWNNIIRAYARQDAPFKALQVYVSMSRTGVLPDSYTLPLILKAACQIFAVGIGKQLHSVAIKIGLQSNEYCESCLISLYSKCGQIRHAYKVFDENPERKLDSWNAIISALSQGGRAEEASEMFIETRRCGLLPDCITMVSVISACGSLLGDLNLAIQLHKYVFHSDRGSGKPDILMFNLLVDMYGKCCRMDLAGQIFSSMDEKNVSSWTSMIVGYAMHGHVDGAIEYFHYMIEAGVRPNYVTFIGVLSACVHGGKVKEGKRYFEMMRNAYGITPQMQHYGCLVDLLLVASRG